MSNKYGFEYQEVDTIRFGPPKNSPEVEVIDYLQRLKPDERTPFLAELFKPYKEKMQQNLKDLQRMAG